MATAQVSFQDLLTGAEKLPTQDLDLFSRKISELLSGRSAKTLNPEESRLMLLINEGLPASLLERFSMLNEKRRAETLSEKEHIELLGLIELTEQKNVERMEALFQLAQIRQVPLRTLMSQLGIRPRG